MILCRYIAQRLVLLALFGLVAQATDAATFANFSAARHNRFLADGSLNPDFWLDHSLLTGVAVSRAVLVTPQHYITATHTATIDPTFVAADGTRHTYTASSSTVLQTILQNDFTKDDGTFLPAGSLHFSDLKLVRLSAPISPSDGITPMAVLGGGYYDMLGRPMILQGQGSQFGSDTIDFTQTEELDTGAISESLIYRWDHPLGGGGPDELTLVGGDSGEGAFIEIGGQYVLTGTNMGIGTDDATGFKYSFNTFIMPYLDEIETSIAADGYSLTVVAVPEPSLLLSAFFIMSTLWVGRRTRRFRWHEPTMR